MSKSSKQYQQYLTHLLQFINEQGSVIAKGRYKGVDIDMLSDNGFGEVAELRQFARDCSDLHLTKNGRIAVAVSRLADVADSSYPVVNAKKGVYTYKEKEPMEQSTLMALIGLAVGIIGAGMGLFFAKNVFVMYLSSAVAACLGLLALVMANNKGYSKASKTVALLTILAGFLMGGSTFLASKLNVVSVPVKTQKQAPGASSSSQKQSNAGNSTSAHAATVDTDDLTRNVSIKLGSFKMTKNKKGVLTTSLPVTVTSLISSKAVYNLSIQAYDKDNNAIGDPDTVLLVTLNGHQSAKRTAFQYVSDSQAQKLAAHGVVFKVVNISKASN